MIDYWIYSNKDSQSVNLVESLLKLVVLKNYEKLS